jgi:hypothetical protein
MLHFKNACFHPENIMFATYIKGVPVTSQLGKLNKKFSLQFLTLGQPGADAAYFNTLHFKGIASRRYWPGKFH